jgi:hypothetical protein
MCVVNSFYDTPNANSSFLFKNEDPNRKGMDIYGPQVLPKVKISSF